MSVPLPSKTVHAGDDVPKKCPSNTIVKNIHAVSLCELLTVDTILAVALGALAAKTVCSGLGLSGVAHVAVCTIVMTVVLVLWILAHVWWGMPSNLAYYFGFGKPPHVFKTCACAPVPANTESFVNDGSGYGTTKIGRVDIEGYINDGGGYDAAGTARTLGEHFVNDGSGYLHPTSIGRVQNPVLNRLMEPMAGWIPGNSPSPFGGEKKVFTF